MLVAHRGFRSPKGENRMVDFVNALKTCKAVEFDIRMTKDKKIIIFHDHNLKRIAKINRTIRSYTYAEIQELDFFKQNPEWLPALFIDDFAKKISSQYQMINVEIKPDRYTAEEYVLIAQALEELSKNTKAEIIVSSFSHNTLAWIKTLDSKFKKGYLMEKPGEYDAKLMQGFDYLHPYLKSIIKNPKLYSKINLPMNIWTFKQSADVVKVKKLYPAELLNAFISDIPDLEI